MARYNHFKESPYKQVAFKDVKVGDKIRVGKYKNGRHGFVIAVKVDKTSYFEQQTKKMVRLHSFVGFMVYEY
jgi:hypothetical protein